MRTSILVSILASIVTIGALCGCGKFGKAKFPIDLDPKHTLVGHTYELTTDCYVFTWKNYKPPFPIFTTHPPAPTLGLPELPEHVSGDHIGEQIDAYKIIGVLKKGSRFRVARVYRISPEDNRFDIYEVDLLDALNPAFPKLDAYWIADRRRGKPNNPPGFALEFVREVKP